MIYLDNSATTRPSDAALSRMIALAGERWGHPSQPHQKGQELYSVMEESLKQIYALLGAADEDGFVFTSSGAEAVAQVIQSLYWDVAQQTGRNHFVAASIDEAPALMAIGRLEMQGCACKLVQPDSSGRITKEAVADALSPRTALVSLSWANGLTGVIHPVGEIATLCEERGILLHLEATHVLGKLYYNLEDVGASYITFNGDNLHAPKGTGGIYYKAGSPLSSLIPGGIEQAGKRAGNFSVAALAGLAESCREAVECRDLLAMETARLRDKLEEGVLQGVPDARIFYRDVERLPNVTAIGFPGVSSEALLYYLSKKGVLASIGGGSYQQIGLLLEAAGVERGLAGSAVSFSLSRETTEEEVERAAGVIVEAAKELQKVSGGII